jgi:hypothetical protein
MQLRRQSAIVSRWLHLHLSMVSFAIVLFFAVNGLTLNHQTGSPSRNGWQFIGAMPADLLLRNSGAEPD